MISTHCEHFEQSRVSEKPRERQSGFNSIPATQTELIKLNTKTVFDNIAPRIPRPEVGPAPSSRLETHRFSVYDKGLVLDAVGQNFEPYLHAGCVCMLVAPCGVTLVHIPELKAVANLHLSRCVSRWRGAQAVPCYASGSEIRE